MQTSELEKNKNHLIGDEECINFRPSPNFKHMKKYLKSKFEEANSSPNQSSDQSTTPNSEDQESVKPQQASSSNMAQRVQPPLPPNSPPPEFLVVPKQEVEDEEYNDRSATQPPTEREEVADKHKERTMCRQFARGMCTRGTTCIYAHELILSQLPGVYTFCKNFQNSICNFPKCKFVHATVFEKEHFYRTGFLPPHTLIHLKESNSALGPPTALEGTPAEASQVFTNPPPAMHPGVSSLPTSGCAPADGPASGPAALGPAPGARNGAAGADLLGLRHPSPAKRDWAELEIAAMAAHDQDNSEPKLKKCKSCDVNELRIQCAKTKLEKFGEQSEMYAKQKLQLMKWDARLNNVLDVMLKSKTGGIGSSTTSLLSPGIMRKDKEILQKPMIDQLGMFLQLNSRMNEMGASQKLILGQILKILEDKSTEARPHSTPLIKSNHQISR